jgi:hypothetical protein
MLHYRHGFSSTYIRDALLDQQQNSTWPVQRYRSSRLFSVFADCARLQAVIKTGCAQHGRSERMQRLMLSFTTCDASAR